MLIPALVRNAKYHLVDVQLNGQKSTYILLSSNQPMQTARKTLFNFSLGLWILYISHSASEWTLKLLSTVLVYRPVLQYKITARRKTLLKRFSVQVKRIDFFHCVNSKPSWFFPHHINNFHWFWNQNSWLPTGWKRCITILVEQCREVLKNLTSPRYGNFTDPFVIV